MQIRKQKCGPGNHFCCWTWLTGKSSRVWGPVCYKVSSISLRETDWLAFLSPQLGFPHVLLWGGDSTKFVLFLIRVCEFLLCAGLPNAWSCFSFLPSGGRKDVVCKICREVVSYGGNPLPMEQWSIDRYNEVNPETESDISLLFFPFRGEKTKSKINQYSLVKPLDIIIHCRCSIIEGGKNQNFKRKCIRGISYVSKGAFVECLHSWMHLTFDFHPL